MVNPDGHCYAFDSRGNGYARGEGVAAVVLKLLDQAIADGDNIHSVIVNSGVNQDGHTAGSIMSPSGEAQAALIRSVYATAGLDPGHTPYVEAHGTGTQVGDKQEVGAIFSVFCEGKDRPNDLAVGSVKANIGHLEATAGIAGLLKSIIVLRSGLVPPQLNIVKLKPQLKLHERNILIPLELTPLAPGPRRASLNSFGYGGTNCHVIVETLQSYINNAKTNGHSNGHSNGVGNGQANGHQRTNGQHNGNGQHHYIGHANGNGHVNGNALHNTDGHHNGQLTIRSATSTNGTSAATKPAQLFLMTANSELSLKLTADNIKTWASSTLAAGKDEQAQSQLLADLAYTLSSRRSNLPFKYSVVASSLAQLADGVGILKGKTVKRSAAADRTPHLAFVFTGQGAQWVGMGRELMSVPAFARSINKSEAYLTTLGCSWSLKKEMMPPVSAAAASRLKDAEIAQPCTTVLQIALVDLMRSLGITPSSVVGHSSGEIGAAYAAGHLDHEAAVTIAFLRGVCSAQAVKNGALSSIKGSMLATGLGEDEIAPYISQISPENGKISVACVNSPQSTTISGDEAAIDELKTSLDAASVFARKLRVDTAYHSHHMAPVASAYIAAMGNVESRTPVSSGDNDAERPTFYSSVTSNRKDGGFGPEYWAENLVSKVRFSEALQSLVQADNRHTDAAGFTFVEIGPAAALGGPAKQTLSAVGVKNSPAYLSALVRETDARVSALTLIGRLIELGHAVRRSKTGPLLAEDENRQHNVVADLKSYPFDESHYWRESRLSSAHRFRPFGHHDLCGLLDPASSLQEPRWTHHLQVSSLPWLRDHVVDGSIIFPASGSVCMVLEAMRQLVQMRTPGITEANVPNFSVSDVVFSKAICLPLDDDYAEIELQLSISPSQEAGGKWETFRIVSYAKNADGRGGGVWEENCSGLVSCDVDLGSAPTSSGDEQIQIGATEHERRLQGNVHKLEQVQEASDAVEVIDSGGFYERLAASGNHYGPEFSLLDDVRVGDDIAWAKVTVPDLLRPHHLVHPTMLDAICHMGALMFKAYCGGAPVVVGSIQDMAMLPVKQDQLKRLSTPGTELVVASTLEPQDSRSCITDVWVLHKHQQTGKLTPLLKSQYILRAYGSGALAANSDSEDDSQKTTGYNGNKAHQLVWKPDAAFLSNRLTRHTTAEEDTATDGYLNAVEQASAIFISRTLAEIKSKGINVTAPHLKKLLDWMQRYHSSDASRARTAHLKTAEDESRAIQAAEDSSMGIEGKIAARMGRALTSVLAGTTEPLGVMTEDGLLGEVFAQARILEASYAQLEDYLALLAFKHPRMKLLEIGAGTGGATLPVLRAMSSGGEDGDTWLESYDYTDVSSSTFEQAKEKFARWAGDGDFMRFGVLNVEQDPTLQGYAAQSYDVVVAVNVLHATKDLQATMTNVRKLLRPGGKLVLVELTSAAAWANLTLGTLPGWWSFEDSNLRSDSPLLRPEQWDDVLLKTGFSGLDVLGHSSKTPAMGAASMMATSAVEPELEDEKGFVSVQLKPLNHVQIIGGVSGSPTIKSVTEGLQIASKQKGHANWASCGLDKASTRSGEECAVVLDVADNSLLLSKSSDVFETLKRLLTEGTNVLWVALQENSGRNDAEDARIKGYKGMIQGVARVLRRENGPSCRLITVDIDGTTDLGNQAVVRDICTRLVEVAEASLVLPSSPSAVDEFYEPEYTLRDRQVLVPRLQTDESFLAWADSHKNAHADADAASSATAKLETDVAFHQPSRPLKLQVAVPGLLSSLRFVDDDANNGTLKPWEIRVSSRAHGINFKDIFVALGQMKAGVTMVGELAGVVTAVGCDMQQRYKPGDRVMGFGSPSHFASDPVLSGHLAHAIPSNLTFAQAASIPVVYATAHHCLFAVARFRKGRTLLVTAASGGVGQAAIQLAQHAGAGKNDIYAVVGSAAKRRLVVERYGIPETHILSSRSRGADLRDAVLRLTGGRGVDVVLNSLSGDMLTAGFECVAKLGAFVEIGKTDIYRGSHIRMSAFDRSITFASVDLIAIGAEQPDTVYETLADLAELLGKGHVQPPSPVTELPISKIDEAFRMIASRKHTGKVVLISEPDATVAAVAPRPEPFRLAEHGAYVIAGGLGDLGRRFAIFLASSGAGHIVLLSRRDLSAEDRSNLEKTVAQANTHGKTRLHIVKCDITVASDMQSCVKYCRKESLLPVRGVIHAGMVLKDRPFVNMSHDDFTGPLGPKVYGTVNLDQAFSSPDLDFFVTLSSVTAQIGNGSQANYVAGNSFQDAFTRARANGGGKTHYISLNLGGILGSAAVENTPQSNRLNAIGMTFDALLSSLEYAMSPAGAKRDGCLQSVLGLCRKSLEDADDTVSLSTPLFSRLPYQKHSNANAASKAGAKVDTEQAVRNASTLAEAEAVVQEAIMAKCAVFLDRPVEDVPSDAPLATIGLDSLVSIELKNWILRAFQATVQTSEISSALSMATLAATVASRSKLISAETRESNSGNEKDVSAAAVVNGIVAKANGSGRGALPPHGFDCCKAAKELPKYPLPDLDATLQTLVTNVSHFATSDEELEGLRRAAAEFSAPGSVGRGLYDQLAARAADPSLDSWLADLHLKGLYLTRRHPIAPWGNFLSTHRDSLKVHGQADRAAIIASEAFRFLLEVEAGTLSPDWLGPQPLCSSSWKWMFNAVREPRPGCDEMMRYPGPENHYCVVLRRGQVFTVPLQHSNDKREPVSQQDLRVAFQEIMDLDQSHDESWAGLLTSDWRDPWATNRTELLGLGKTNEAYLQAVERAAFVVCLDEGRPETNEERVRQSYLGDGFNRWFDKSTQFIVAANGRSAQLMEHSNVDGLSVLRLTERIHDAIQAHSPMSSGNGSSSSTATTNGNRSSPVKITRFTLETTPEIAARIQKLRATYSGGTATKRYAMHTVPTLGIATALGTGLTPKACADLAIQVANRLHFGGTNPGSWEPVSTQHFHRGRPELVQVVTEAVSKFCATAVSVDLDQPQQLREAQKLARTAIEQWEQSVREAAQGGAFLRLWDTLQGMLPAGVEDKDKPAIFTDPVFWRAFPGRVFHARNEAEVEDNAIGVHQEGGLWMSYSIKEHSIAVSVVGGKGNVEDYGKCLETAGRIVRAIVKA
ncbi:unnamed protein product [Discula destructiva]